jgi:hypothetical protein
VAEQRAQPLDELGPRLVAAYDDLFNGGR